MAPQFLNPYRPAFYLIQVGIWASYWVATRLVWLAYTPPPWQYNVSEKLLGFLWSTALAFIFWGLRNKKFREQVITGLLLTSLFGLLWRVSYNTVDIHLLRENLPKDLSIINYFWHGSMAVLRLLPWSIGYFLLTYYMKYLYERDAAQNALLQAKEAQLKLLHLQISPHFLFNVLNSLDTLLLKDNVAESRQMLGKLSLFLRQTLSENPEFNIPLKQEIERARTYVDIERVRFQDKLLVDWDIDKRLEDFKVPSLILQPLIENAIKHSVSKSLHGGKITVSAREENDCIVIEIANKANGEADSIGETNGLGIGLENTISRLQVTYGDEAHLSSKKRSDGTFVVRIVIGENKLAG